MLFTFFQYFNDYLLFMLAAIQAIFKSSIIQNDG
jgi:hypothetical protein